MNRRTLSVASVFVLLLSLTLGASGASFEAGVGLFNSSVTDQSDVRVTISGTRIYGEMRSGAFGLEAAFSSGTPSVYIEENELKLDSGEASCATILGKYMMNVNRTTEIGPVVAIERASHTLHQSFGSSSMEQTQSTSRVFAGVQGVWRLHRMVELKGELRFTVQSDRTISSVVSQAPAMFQTQSTEPWMKWVAGPIKESGSDWRLETNVGNPKGLSLQVGLQGGTVTHGEQEVTETFSDSLGHSLTDTFTLAGGNSTIASVYAGVTYRF